MFWELMLGVSIQGVQLRKETSMRWIQEPFAVEPLRNDSGLIFSRTFRISLPKSELQGKHRRYGQVEPRNLGQGKTHKQANT